MKITLTRLFETSKAASTEAGKQLAEFIDYMSQLAEQTVRNLRNGLTFQDNFNCDVRAVTLTHDTEQIISTSKPAANIYGVIPIRVVSSTTGVDSFEWYVNQSGELVVKVGLTNAPSDAQSLTLLILFV